MDFLNKIYIKNIYIKKIYILNNKNIIK